MRPVGEGIAAQVEQHLRPLVGLPLSVARRAADLRNFQFGAMRAVERGTVGEWALHIQCPWRIEGPEGIVTGRSDLWKPTETPVDWDSWDYEQGNVQDQRMLEWLGAPDPATRSCRNVTGLLVVEQVVGDDYGGAVIHLSGGYRLVLFPAGTASEDWRLFQPGTDGPHFVVWGASLESPALRSRRALTRPQVEAAFQSLVGEPLTDMWRYAGCQKFEFGEQKPSINSDGEEITVADLGLVVSCDWSVTGPAGAVVSSADFGPREARRDTGAHPFYDLLATSPPVVEAIAVDDHGLLHIRMSDGYALEVQPDADFEPHDEQWRLMLRGEPRAHVVLWGDGVVAD